MLSNNLNDEIIYRGFLTYDGLYWQVIIYDKNFYLQQHINDFEIMAVNQLGL